MLFCSGSVLPDAIAGFIRNVPPVDTAWIDTTSKRAAQKLEKLDTDLKNYRGNSIKESIRCESVVIHDVLILILMLEIMHYELPLKNLPRNS